MHVLDAVYMHVLNAMSEHDLDAILMNIYSMFTNAYVGCCISAYI